MPHPCRASLARQGGRYESQSGDRAFPQQAPIQNWRSSHCCDSVALELSQGIGQRARYRIRKMREKLSSRSSRFGAPLRADRLGWGGGARDLLQGQDLRAPTYSLPATGYGHRVRAEFELFRPSLESCQALTKVFSLIPRHFQPPNPGTKPGKTCHTKNREIEANFPSNKPAQAGFSIARETGGAPAQARRRRGACPSQPPSPWRQAATGYRLLATGYRSRNHRICHTYIDNISNYLNFTHLTKGPSVNTLV